jgi:hypothetical protein
MPDGRFFQPRRDRFAGTSEGNKHQGSALEVVSAVSNVLKKGFRRAALLRLKSVRWPFRNSLGKEILKRMAVADKQPVV